MIAGDSRMARNAVDSNEIGGHTAGIPHPDARNMRPARNPGANLL